MATHVGHRLQLRLAAVDVAAAVTRLAADELLLEVALLTDHTDDRVQHGRLFI